MFIRLFCSGGTIYTIKPSWFARLTNSTYNDIMIRENQYYRFKRRKYNKYNIPNMACKCPRTILNKQFVLCQLYQPTIPVIG